MDRRTFVLLGGAASAALWRPIPVPATLARPTRAGSLRFDLDEQRRWSLSYHGAAEPVPLLRPTTLGVRVGDTLVTLADLEDISVGNRRPPGGESLVLRGRAPAPAPAPDSAAGGVRGGAWVEVEFAAWEAGPGAQGAITVSIYPDRMLVTIKGVQFFSAAEADVLPGAGPLFGLVNGYQSASPCHVALVGAAEASSFAALALTRQADRGGLAVVFDPGEPGQSRVALAGGRLDAVSDWVPARPVRPEGDAATMRIAFLPDGDGLAALGALATPSSALDRERLAALAVPTGWVARSGVDGTLTEGDVLANLEFCAAHFDRRSLRYIQIGDGYQRALGDWDANPRFPRGHRGLTDRIHASGFLAGLWVAPFGVTERSGLPAAHPDWLLQGPAAESGDPGGPAVVDTRATWGGAAYALDGAHPDVQQWLYDLARRIVRDWGYDYIHVDFLDWATAGAAHYGGLTHAEAYRRGLAALRDGVGTEAFLMAGGAPLQHAAGLVNGMRIGPEVQATWYGIQPAARAAALRSPYHRAVWLNHPGAVVARTPLTVDEARGWAAVVAASGGVTFLADDLPTLPPDRLALLQKILPVAAAGGRPVGTQVAEREVAPAVVAGDAIVPLRGPWRFRTGDDPRYAAREYDDDTWEIVPVPQIWERAGHPDYDGRAWYRTRFTLPPGGPGTPRPAHLELGRVDDADATFVNGTQVGEMRDRMAYRRYALPAGALNWGGENVLAVRVTDEGGPGGLWHVRRDRPAATWVVEGAPRWWTMVLVNWDDEPWVVRQGLAALGISGSRFAAYDIWAERPLSDVRQTVEATLAPHANLTLALRPVASRPQVIGTTRHVIQGAVDVVDERWDAASRTLSGKAMRLDGRPYAVTIAMPVGGVALRPTSCTADVPCTMRTLDSGHAVLEWPAGTTADIGWQLRCQAAAGRRAGPL